MFLYVTYNNDNYFHKTVDMGNFESYYLIR